MATSAGEIDAWCNQNGLDSISDNLKEWVETLDDLKYADDSDVAEIIAALKMPMKIKLKFKKCVAGLKDAPKPNNNNESKDESKDDNSIIEPGMSWNANTNDNSGIIDEKEGSSFVLKADMPRESGVYVIPTIKKSDISGSWKTIMVIGETGSGKSTTLNSMINYLWGVELEDHYRFVLIPPPSEQAAQGKSVTSDVTSYHFKPPMLGYGLTVVDTPGFADTKGLSTDAEIVKKIEKSFKNDLDTIDAVFFVLKASQSRLTAIQTYVFNSMLRVFGKDIASNLFLLITFCDGDDPPVYASVKAYDLPYKDAFELNNSAFFTGFQEYFQTKQVRSLNVEKDCLNKLSDNELNKWLECKPEPQKKRKVTKQFWEMGMDAMKTLFDALNQTSAKSLKLSRKVLDLRNHLQLRIEHLHKRITDGLNLIAYMRQIIDTIKTHAKEVNGSKDFEIEVQDTKLVKINTANNVTTCSNCKYTCHENCAYSNNADKRDCGAMDSNGYCGVCPKKCWWNCHTNENYFLRNETYTKTVTKNELKAKFDQSTQGMTTAERIIISKSEEILQLQSQVCENIKDVRMCIETLGDIALKPCVMEEDDYYELMITSEEEQKEPNYKDRIKAIKQLRDQAKHVRILENSLKGKETGALFDTQLKQLQKDLQDIKAIQGEAPEAASQVLQRVGDRIINTTMTFNGVDAYGHSGNNYNNSNHNEGTLKKWAKKALKYANIA